MYLDVHVYIICVHFCFFMQKLILACILVHIKSLLFSIYIYIFTFETNPKVGIIRKFYFQHVWCSGRQRLGGTHIYYLFILFFFIYLPIYLFIYFIIYLFIYIPSSMQN